jgi:serine/threonine protein kinase
MMEDESLRAFALDGVIETPRQLGNGAYATVFELHYKKSKCAGKKIHEVLLDQDYCVRRFGEECHISSRLRHPNVVQFLGFFFKDGERAPMLVMEFLPFTLASAIRDYSSTLPQEFVYSILRDIAVGLNYFHTQTRPIIHCDLTSSNILLTNDMVAKISDLGVARLLPLTVSRVTPGAPGTLDFMPPEAQHDDPDRYTTSIDIFSYGIIMIHMLSGSWPTATRRIALLEVIGNDHPLMNTIRRCINDKPTCRGQASELVEHMAGMVSNFPLPSANYLELVRDHGDINRVRELESPVQQVCMKVAMILCVILQITLYIYPEN